MRKITITAVLAVTTLTSVTYTTNASQFFPDCKVIGPGKAKCNWNDETAMQQRSHAKAHLKLKCVKNDSKKTTYSLRKYFTIKPGEPNIIQAKCAKPAHKILKTEVFLDTVSNF